MNDKMGEDVDAMADDIFTLAEAARYAGASRYTLEKYHLRGELPGTRTAGGVYLFRRGDLDAVKPIIAGQKLRLRSDEGAEKRRKRRPDDMGQ